MTASPCSTIDRSRAFLRAVAICQGHSVMCATCGVSDACPITTGEAAETSLLREQMIAMNDALDRAALVKGAGR